MKHPKVPSRPSGPAASSAPSGPTTSLAPSTASTPSTPAKAVTPLRLQLHLHGSARVQAPGQAAVPLRGRAAALVALAVLQPDTSRGIAAQLLWPEAPHPRNNLRQQLLRFRQTLGTDLLQGTDPLRLAAGVQLQAAAAGAVLLADEDADASEWGQWLQRQRQSEQQARWQPLLRALAQAEGADDLDAALHHAQALLSAGPQEEAHHQALMRVHYLRGEPAAGLAVYRAWAERLAGRLGSRPADATEQLATALRSSGSGSSRGSSSGSFSARAAAPQGPAAPPLSTDPGTARPAWQRDLPVTLKRPPQLLGRSAEQAAVQRAWAQGQAVLLQGEAGLGKSRLMSELLAEVAAAETAPTTPTAQSPQPLQPPQTTRTTQTAKAAIAATAATAAKRAPRLLAAAGRPGDSAAPYTTLSRLLQTLAPGAALVHDDSSRRALALLLPGLTVAADAVTPPAALAQPLQPGALQAAVARLLAAADVQTVALDDLHFADDATVDVVASLIAHTELPLRWLLASRAAESSSAAHRLSEGLGELRRLQTVHLSPLDEASVAQFLDSLGIAGLRGGGWPLPASSAAAPRPAPGEPMPTHLAPGSAGFGLVSALVRHTGGNPLFLLETLKLGLVDGSLLAGRLPHPEAVGSLIERRLRQLSSRALALARVAAIAGSDFSVELAAHATAVPAVELADAWAELEQAQVLRECSFAHDLVCDAVLRTVPAAVARHLHAVVAAWLAERQTEPGRVARHWLAAAQPQRALGPLAQAAQRASAAVRPAEALAFYEQMQHIHAREGHRAAEAEVLFKMTECLRLLDDDERTPAVLDRLQAIASHDGERARGWLAASRLANETRHIELALSHARQALACAQAQGDAELTGRSRMQLALLLGESVQAAEAQLHLQAARGWALQAGPDVRHEFQHCSALVAMNLEDFPAAIQAYEQLLSDPEAVADAHNELMLWGNLAVAQAGMGALRAALVSDEKRRALVALHQVGGVSQNYLELNAATLLLGVGRYLDAMGFLERAEARAVPDQAMLHLRWATLLFQLGQHARALQHVARCEAAETVHPIVKLTAGLLRLQVQQASGGPTRLDAALLARSSELAEQDRRQAAWVRRELSCSEFATAEQGLLHADRAIERAARAHLHGLRLAGHTLRIEHALALGQAQRVHDDMRLVLTLRETYECTTLYRCRVGWAAVRVLRALGAAEAQTLLAREVAWVQRTAREQVPAAFRASFLEHNPVNRALLAAATTPLAGR